MKKEIIYSIISLIIGLLLAFLIGEIASRIYYFGGSAFSYQKIKNFAPLGETDFLEKAEGYKQLYKLKPNIDSYFKLVHFQTNDAGLRDKAYNVEKPGNTVRGIVVGDSYTMGSGVPIEDVYHSVVEQKLNENSDETAYELINFGVGGYNLLNYLGLLETQVLKYKPDFIIVGFCGTNDFKTPHKKHYSHEIYFENKYKNRFWKSYFIFMIKTSNLWKSSRAKPRKRMIRPKEKQFINNMFEKFAAFQKQHNIDIFIQYLSMRGDIENLEVVRQVAKKHDLKVIDSHGKFDYENIKQMHISELDAHPNSEANAIFAQSLLDDDGFQHMIIQKTENVGN